MPRANLSTRQIVVATLLALTGAGALAQTSGPPSATEAAAESPQIAEVLVTARRKQESAQDVPVSVSAFSGAALTDLGINTSDTLQKLVPGVILNSAGSISNTTYTIRGQGKNVTGPGLPSVITYVNEVPLPSIGSSAPTFDIDNVQVLKGPQGTLFGRNTTGGAVLVYSKQPTFQWGGYAQVDLGNYREHSFQGALNIPVVNDILAVRVATDIERQDGYTHNITTGHDQDNTDSNSFRLSILLQPLERVRNVLVADYQVIRSNGQGFFPFQVLNPQLEPTAAAQRALGERTVQTTIAPFDNESYWGVANTTTLEVTSAVTVKNIVGYRFSRADNYQNASGLPSSPLPDLGPALAALGYVPGQPGTLITTRNKSVTDQLSEEIQASGSLLSSSLDWIAGAFYLDARDAGPDYLTLDLFRPTPPTALTSAIVNGFLGGVWPVGSLSNTFYGDQSKALYLNGGYDLGKLVPAAQGIRLNAGFRYTWDRESICSNSVASTSLATGASLVPPYPDVDACHADAGNNFNSFGDFHAASYNFGVDYKLSEDLFFYFTTRHGYRAGGLNSPVLAPALAPFQTFKPQKVTDYEVGTHLKWNHGDWDGRFNLAVFHAKFTDIQATAAGITAASGIPGVDASNQPSNSSLEINAGTSSSDGVEADTLISLLHKVSLSLGGAYLNQSYDQLSAPAVLAPFFSASHFTGSPKWSFNAAVNYDLPVPSDVGTLSARAAYYYVTQQYQGQVLLPSYGIADAQLRWADVYQKPFDVTLYVDNALDKLRVRNIILSTASFGVYSGTYAPPRMYGVRVSYKFGQ